MADEELSSAQKLAIGANFVLNSPPAQVNVVMEGALRFFFAKSANCSTRASLTNSSTQSSHSA